MTSGAVLVTGATGFLGRHVCARLQEEGSAVTRWTRATHGDVTDAARVRAAVKGHDVVVHLASSSARHAVEDPGDDARTNVLGTLHVAQAALAEGAALVHTSTAHVFGPGPRPVADDAPHKPVTLYGASKSASETIVLTHARAFGLDACVVRMPSLFGSPVEGPPPPSVVARFAEAALAGAPLTLHGDPARPVDVLDVRHAARAIAQLAGEAASAWRGETWNVGPRGPLPLRRLAEVVRDAAGSASPIQTSPAQGAPMPVLDARKALARFAWLGATDVETDVRAFVSWRAKA